MPYPTYTAEDFCKDPDFIDWVTAPTPESNRFWRAFLRDHPQQETEIQRAVDYIKMVQFQEVNPSPQDLARLKQRIWDDIDHPVRPLHEPERGPGRVIQWYQRPYWAAAAVVLLISALGAGWWQYQATASPLYETAYGQLREIRLPDGSVVTLNANSSLKVARNMGDAPTREVWLTGEAYFDIARRQGAKFIVHTPEANIEVLGTEFNVNTRRARTDVVLHEGRVKLTADNQSAVVMKPGDLATVTPVSNRIRLKRVLPEQHDAWKASYLVLDGKTLPEIITTLEDTFGVTIKLDTAQLTAAPLTGRLRTKVADDCIDNLAIILDAKVEKEGNTYRFR